MCLWARLALTKIQRDKLPPTTHRIPTTLAKLVLLYQLAQLLLPVNAAINTRIHNTALRKQHYIIMIHDNFEYYLCNIYATYLTLGPLETEHLYG